MQCGDIALQVSNAEDPRGLLAAYAWDAQTHTATFFNRQALAHIHTNVCCLEYSISISRTPSILRLAILIVACSQDTCGQHPAYVAIAGSHALVANYTGGSVSVLPLQADGSLAPASDSKHHHGALLPHLADRQESAHPHAIRLDPYVGKVRAVLLIVE